MEPTPMPERLSLEQIEAKIKSEEFPIDGKLSTYQKLKALQEFHKQEVAFLQSQIPQWVSVEEIPVSLYNTDLVVTDGHRMSLADYNKQRGWGLQSNLYFEPTHFMHVNPKTINNAT